MQYLKTIHGEYLNVAQMMQITVAGIQPSRYGTFPAYVQARYVQENPTSYPIVLVASPTGQYLRVNDCWILCCHKDIEEAQANLTRIMDEIVNGKQVIEC